MRAVFIGDDSGVANFTTISIRLRWPDFTPMVATTPTLGLGMVEEQSPDVVLLHDTRTVNVLAQTVQELRRFSAVPLLVMGAQPDQLQIVSALELGADDYIRLPCGLTELMARVLAVLRRAGIQGFDDGEGPLVKGDLLLNPATYEAFLGERRLKLTVTEFRLLHVLAKNSGRVVPHQTLERTLWGERWNCGGLVKKYVQRLRSKLEDNAQGTSCIASVHGVGYRFVGSDQPSHIPAATTSEDIFKKAFPAPQGVDGALDPEKLLIKESLGVA